MSFCSTFEIIKVVVPEPCISFSIPASIVEAAAVITNRAKIFFPVERQFSLMNPLIY